jgi:hypothetical protein
MLGKYVPGRGWALPASFWAYGRLGIPVSIATPCIEWSLLMSLRSSVFLAAVLSSGRNVLSTEIRLIGGCLLALCFLFPDILHTATNSVLRLFRCKGISGRGFSRIQLLSLFAAYGVGWFVYGVGFFCLVYSVAPVPAAAISQVAGIFILAQVSGFLSVFAPAGIGVREGILLVGLTPLIGDGNAIVVAVVCRVWQTALEFVLSAFGWWALSTGWRLKRSQTTRAGSPSANVGSKDCVI